MTVDDAAKAGPDLASWRRGVAAVLAKAQRKDAAEFGATPDDHLVTETLDGLGIRPLYTSADELPEPPLPGSHPFVRGADPHRDTIRGWHVTCRFDGTGDSVHDDVVGALENGASALWLVIGRGAITVDSLARVLDGVYLDLAPVMLDAGSEVATAANAVLSLLDERGRDERFDRATARISLGAAPLTTAFARGAGSARESIDMAAAVSLAQAALARSEQIRAFLVDATVFHDAGASDTQEVGAACAAGIAYVQAMMAAGMPAADALSQVEFRFSVTDDQFQSIAKLRAARQAWARIAEVLGAPEAGSAPQHAVTSAAMLTQRDPWVNMLRGTVAAFGAGVGGADFVTVLPFDAALPPGSMGISEAFAQRIARNTQLLLLEESNLGRVLDPAAGSWFVESLTATIAAAAWEFLQEIERRGGLDAAIVDGWLGEQIATTRGARDQAVAERRWSITGVNEFPDLGEKPAQESAGTPLIGDQVHRYAEPFETLRDRSDAHLARTGERPRVLLAPLGPLAEHNVRTTFVMNFLAAGGIEGINPGPTSLDELGSAAKEAGTTVAVVCGTDARYGTEATEAISALRGSGIGTVLVAGSARALPEDALTDDARPDGFVSARMDAARALAELLDQLGVQ
ncbi:methylmalonyl-CoA mutase [Hoyosella sp. G463]|uniref:methylmalonyl-CoA mutase n=1 Tax=Lolliginicoccus lacisalsi TaxID=2742202 RepID=A0A927J9S5_9ACTN|nr:methylmalonyl-CoA mutase family protein [Lolliginicoccus lacisalsi]MBD8505213.1 methylmalonyl-CoA mutase [Lolliginicoccus lacisalsi]